VVKVHPPGQNATPAAGDVIGLETDWGDLETYVPPIGMCRRKGAGQRAEGTGVKLKGVAGGAKAVERGKLGHKPLSLWKKHATDFKARVDVKSVAT
jgi:hypothetical protein